MLREIVLKSERLSAILLLNELFKNRRSLNELFDLSQAQVENPALLKALCFGLCRHYHELNAIALQLVDKKPKKERLWLTLLSGLYQLKYMEMPDYAVVKESVALLKPLKLQWAKGLVNAVLRNFCRNQATIEAKLSNDEACLYSHPQWLLQAIQRVWPEHWQSIAKENNQHPPMVLRVNTKMCQVEVYLEKLAESGFTGSIIGEQAIKLDKPCDVWQLPGFSEGFVSVQDSAAQQAAHLLSLQPSMRVLDACCAPGGKTCHMLETEPEIACIALDVENRRLSKVQENLDRLNLQARLVCGDGLNPDAWWDGQLFDRALLDAPCSATGVIRRHPDIKLLRTPEEVESISQVQKGLLASLWPLLKPGGLLLYATCSILPIENDEQIKNFCDNHEDVTIHPLQLEHGVQTDYGWQMFPEITDGFYYSLLEKKGA